MRFRKIRFTALLVTGLSVARADFPTVQPVPQRADFDERGFLGLAFHPDYGNTGQPGEVSAATRTVLPPEVDPDTARPTGGIFRIEPILTELTAHLEPARDNSLFEENDNSNGKGEWLFAGLTLNNDDRRALLQFDIHSRIPSGSVITAVTLRLSMDRTIAGPVDFDLHRLTRNWGEGGSDAPGEEGTGTGPAAEDATWNFAKFNTEGWTAAGGDFDGVASATTPVDQAGNYEWSSAQMVRDVQDWLDGSADNFGWILLSTDPDPPTAKRFKSRESESVEQRPSLWIDYVTDSPPQIQPDGMIRGKGGPRKGDNVYNLNARRQTIKLRRPSGARFDHRFSLQNDGNVSDDFVVKGTRRNRFFVVTYFHFTPAGRRNVTGDLVRGSARVVDLKPGEISDFLAKVRSIRDRRGRTRRRQFSYLSSSGTEAIKRDKVKVKAFSER